VIEIQEGALFIADSHYPHHGSEIITLLQNLPQGTPQIFLMGDIFDILFDHASLLMEYNQKLIDLINVLSQQIEVFYFEGNHDFNLQTIFPNVSIFALAQQPQFFSLDGKSVALAHGDKFTMGLGYRLYTKLIRTPWIRRLIPFQTKIIQAQIRKLKSKKICTKFDGFEERIEKILEHYQSDLVIEGHYHQGLQYQNYIALPSLVCQKQIGIIKNGKLIFTSIPL